MKGEVTVAMIMRAVDRLPAEKQPRLTEAHPGGALGGDPGGDRASSRGDLPGCDTGGHAWGTVGAIAIASGILMKARKKVRFRGGRLERREYEHEIGRLRDARKERGE